MAIEFNPGQFKSNKDLELTDEQKDITGKDANEVVEPVAAFLQGKIQPPRPGVLDRVAAPLNEFRNRFGPIKRKGYEGEV
jgi:hypothetical protein